MTTTKIAAIIIVAYLLYYAGNMIYDLLLKKGITAKPEETEEFSLLAFAEKNKDEMQDIGIEDVENLMMPETFNRKELIPSANEHQEERQDIEFWRNKFESEQSIDSFKGEVATDVVQSADQKVLHAGENEEKAQHQRHEIENPPARKSNKNKWYQMLNLAETSIQLISHPDGYKIYQSTM